MAAAAAAWHSCLDWMQSSQHQHDDDDVDHSIWTQQKVHVKQRVYCIAVHDNPSQSCRVSPATWDHTVLQATWHKWTCPTLAPVRQAGTRFTYPEETEGWVGLIWWLVIYQDVLVVHRQSPILTVTTSPKAEPTTSWSQVPRRHPDCFAIKPPCSYGLRTQNYSVTTTDNS